MRITMPHTTTVQQSSLFRTPSRIIGLALAIVVVPSGSFALSPLSARASNEPEAPLTDTLDLGQGLAGAIDQRTGTLSMHVPVTPLAGPGTENIEIGLSYRGTARLAFSADQFSLGHGWTWALGSFLTVDGDVQLHTSTGESFVADSSTKSGLAHYDLGNIRFSPLAGTLTARLGIANPTEYAYIADYADGQREYFNATGDLVASEDLFGNRTDFQWTHNHRLTGIVNPQGQSVTLEWNDHGVTISSPVSGRDERAITRIDTTDHGVSRVTTPLDDELTFEYATSGDGEGLLTRASSLFGAVTTVTYQLIAGEMRAVNDVVVRDPDSGTEFTRQSWSVVGEHTAYGFPALSSEQALWESGDKSYRYATRLSNSSGAIETEYNSAGLVISRRAISGANESRAYQEHHFTYPHVGDGDVAGLITRLSRNVNPTETRLVIRNDNGDERVLIEKNAYDDAGRVIRHESADGTRTDTRYDETVVTGRSLSLGLPVEENVTGHDGLHTRTTHVLANEGRSIRESTVTRSSPSEQPQHVSHLSRIIDEAGFVKEETTAVTNPDTKDVETETTRYDRTFNRETRTTAVTRTNFAGTDVEAVTTNVTDTATGALLRSIDATGRVSHTAYDAAGRVLSQTDHAGKTTTVEYTHRVTRSTDSTGITRSDHVDALGRVIRKTDNIGIDENGVAVPRAGTERTYETRDITAGYTRITDARGEETTTHHDRFGRTRAVTRSSGFTKRTDYDDAFGTVTTGLVETAEHSLDEAKKTTTGRYDNNNQLVSATENLPDEQETSETRYSYNSLGHVTQKSSPALTTEISPHLNGLEPTKTTYPTGSDASHSESQTTHRTYTASGVPTQKIRSTSTGIVTPGISRTLDPAGRTQTRTNQTGQTTHYEYTIDGLVSRIVDKASGVETQYEYDTTTRLLAHSHVLSTSGERVERRYTYEPRSGRLIALFDPTDQAGTEIRYRYDAFGNTIETMYPDGSRIRHRFDETGRKTATIDTNGNTTTYDYGTNELLKRVTLTAHNGDEIAHVNNHYDGLGRLVTLERENGVTTHYRYTAASKVASEETLRGDTPLVTAAYRYDTRGNLTHRSDVTFDSAGTMQTTETQYDYNAYDQLVASAINNDGVPGVDEKTEYELGVSGEVITETTTRGDETVRRMFDHNPLGQTVAITAGGERTEQNYDAAGNLVVAADETRYSYNILNQPVHEARPDGTEIETTYWIDGNRRALTTHEREGVHSVTSYWDGMQLANETHRENSNQTVTTNTHVSYLVGNARHARVTTQHTDARAIQYYVTDRHGSTSALTDAGGNVSASYRYSDYGAVTPTVNGISRAADRNPFQYAGEYTLPSGTQLLGSSRSYSPALHAFTTRDRADQFNLYAYAGGNPITFVDPTGQSRTDDTGASGVIVGLLVFTALIALASAVPSTSATVFQKAVFAVGGLGEAAITIAQGVHNFGGITMSAPLYHSLTAASLAIGGAAAAHVLRTRAAARQLGAAKKHDIDMTSFADESAALQRKNDLRLLSEAPLPRNVAIFEEPGLTRGQRLEARNLNKQHRLQTNIYRIGERLAERIYVQRSDLQDRDPRAYEYQMDYVAMTLDRQGASVTTLANQVNDIYDNPQGRELRYRERTAGQQRAARKLDFLDEDEF